VYGLFEEDRVKRRIAVAAVLAATLIGAAACGSGSKSNNNTPAAGPALKGSLSGAGQTDNAWIMADAQNPKWLPILNDAIARFKAETGADVKVNFTSWGNHLQQLDAALQANNGPDVVELGNTEAPKYVFGGGLVDVSSVTSKFDNSSSWLQGLSGACLQDGHMYCIPYYAGTRLAIYRTDLFQKAGVASAPTTQADLLADLDKIKAANASNKNFVAWNMPGRYWYAAMSYVYTNGGVIADKQGGQWKGELESAAAQAGLQQWANVVKNYSTTTTATVNEADMDTLYETGNVALEYDAGWHSGVVQQVHTNPNDPNSPMKDTPVKGKVDLFAMPGISASQPFKSFLGGSVLGVTKDSKNQALAAEFIKFYTDTKSETAFISLGNLPNATSLLDAASKDPAVGPQVAAAAQASWFTPASPNWANVESQQVLQDMCQAIATGTDPMTAAAAADTKIASILNAG
jgi:N,N'-diacetylchitobiose transport system substrate-binding protein